MSIDTQKSRNRRLRDTRTEQLVNIGFFASEFTSPGARSAWSTKLFPLCLAPGQALFGPGRDQGALDFSGYAKSKGKHFGANGIAQLVAFFSGVDLDIFLHERVQDAHNFQQRTAQAGELADQQHIPRLQLNNERTELAHIELFGAAYCLFNPSGNSKLLFISKAEEFIALVVH